jgi:hypothetical protein
MFSTVPDGPDWNWLRQLQSNYHKLAQAFLTTYFTKGTKADDNPPKAKHVRRILVSLLRDPLVTPIQLAQFAHENRPWMEDPRITAKCLYILLILLQYRTDVSQDAGVGQFTDKMVTYHVNHPPITEKLQLAANVAQRIGAIIHAKLAFHTARPEVHGNFHVPTTCPLAPIIPELRKHLKGVLYETHGIQAAVTQSTDFAATVLWQPMVEETCSSYRLLKSIDKDHESATMLKECEQLISVLPMYPYVATTIIFPTDGEVITIPRERYPRVF